MKGLQQNLSVGAEAWAWPGLWFSPGGSWSWKSKGKNGAGGAKQGDVDDGTGDGEAEGQKINL